MNESITVNYIGHATTLLEFGATRVLTDPFFASSFMGSQRTNLHNFDPVDLPTPEAIVVSHVGYGHFDEASFRYLSSDIPVIVPEGSYAFIDHLISNPIIELSHFAAYTLPSGLEITAVPADHPSFSLRHFRPKKANAYLLRHHGKQVYFCGASAFGPSFNQIMTGTPDIDIALLPIGGSTPSWLFGRFNMSPEDALKATVHLRAKHMIPLLWGSFPMLLGGRKNPIDRLQRALIEIPELALRTHIVQPGEKMAFGE
ncbi:MAG: MBL fold metallo-hydrolase [Deltaproteobacteria bacterium]|nr:MBL fold metallo-hydrolase [Deltaproteobacteria bacterium]